MSYAKRFRLVAFLVFFVCVLWLTACTFDFFVSKDEECSLDNQFCDIVESSTEFVPSWARGKWTRTEYLIAFGIPSEDSEPRRRRRNLQREHCWSGDGAASLANGWSGEMIAVYVMGRSPLHHFEYSAALEREARRWQDMLTLPMNDGRKTTKKQIGSGGNWGLEAEVGMSRKTFLWLYLSLHLFPKTIYVGKCDDDGFIRVPVFLKTMRMLPRKSMYWGNFREGTPKKFNVVTKNSSSFLYAGGACMTVAKDLVEKFLSYQSLHEVIFLPYKNASKMKFVSFAMQNEDVMVGYILHNSAFPNIVYVQEPMCRIHDVHGGGSLYPLTLDSVFIHHVRESDYKRLNEFFRYKTNFTNSVIHHNEFQIEIKCSLNTSELFLLKVP